MWRRAVASFKTHVGQNQLLSAGLWMGAVGGVGGGLYVAAGHGTDIASRAVFSSVTVRNKEDAFGWVVDWVGENGNSFVTANRMQLRVTTGNPSAIYDAATPPGDLLFEPGLGTHLFRHNGKYILLHRQAQDTITSGFDRQPYTPEVIQLWCFGPGSTLRRFLSACREVAVGKEAGKTPLYVPDHGEWRKVCVRRARGVESVILPGGTVEEVLRDARGFLEEGERYARLGVPYRRGYLLYGPPGCGKSSLVASIAGELKLGIASISLNARGLDDAGLSTLLRDSPQNAVLLLEDVDSVFLKRELADSDSSLVTFSGLLNALDGVASQEGRMLVMTTNNVESLDPALLRPGRCDVKLHLGTATGAQAGAMYGRFVKDGGESEKQLFAEFMEQNRVSMAAVQAFLLKYRTAKDCAANLRASEFEPPRPTPSPLPPTLSSYLAYIGMSHHQPVLEAAGVTTPSDIPHALPTLDIPPVDSGRMYAYAASPPPPVTTAQLDSLLSPHACPPETKSRLVSSLQGRVTYEAAASAIAAFL